MQWSWRRAGGGALDVDRSERECREIRPAVQCSIFQSEPAALAEVCERTHSNNLIPPISDLNSNSSKSHLIKLVHKCESSNSVLTREASIRNMVNRGQSSTISPIELSPSRSTRPSITTLLIPPARSLSSFNSSVRCRTCPIEIMTTRVRSTLSSYHRRHTSA